MNLYAYCGNDGMNCTDPSGMEAEITKEGNNIHIVQYFKVKKSKYGDDRFNVFKRYSSVGMVAATKDSKYNVTYEARRGSWLKCTLGGCINTFKTYDSDVWDVKYADEHGIIPYAVASVENISGGETFVAFPSDIMARTQIGSGPVNKIALQGISTHEGPGHGLGLQHVPHDPSNLMFPQIDGRGTTSTGQLTDEQVESILEHPASKVREK